MSVNVSSVRPPVIGPIVDPIRTPDGGGVKGGHAADAADKASAALKERAEEFGGALRDAIRAIDARNVPPNPTVDPDVLEPLPYRDPLPPHIRYV